MSQITERWNKQVSFIEVMGDKRVTAEVFWDSVSWNILCIVCVLPGSLKVFLTHQRNSSFWNNEGVKKVEISSSDMSVSHLECTIGTLHPLLLFLGKNYRKTFLGNNLNEHNNWDSLQTFGNRYRRPVILHRELTSSIFTMAASYSITHSQGFHGNKESTVLASAQSAAALQPPRQEHGIH